MPRSIGKLLGVAFLAALVAHAADLAPGLGLQAPALGAHIGSTLLQLAGALLCGRVLLAYLPPGDVGAHDLRALPATLATSLALGLPLSRLAEGHLLAAGVVVAVALLLRWLTLPGAMVPRHGVPDEPRGLLDELVAALAVLWGAYLVLCTDGLQAPLWFALFVLHVHALGVARRRRLGRHALLVLGAFPPLLATEQAHPAALALGLGAGALVPWLRRHDRRAGALAGLGFGALFLDGPDPLAVAAVLVLVLASHPRQRGFALAWSGGAAVLALALAALAHGELLPARCRPLFADVLAERGLDRTTFGLAWPIAGAALLLGALSFPWRARPWTPGEIEPPRREALALAALLALACVALALPLSPWSEEEGLVILFPLAALLAGLLLVPPERA